jgi:hypothetical protein
MNTRQPQRKPFITRIISLIIWALIFTLIYAQSPLFTSNQNQYFLHGFARAGFGHLNQDWLANTLDPTPIFSLLVEYTERLFRTELLFYIYYACLLCIYLYSVFGIIDSVFRLRESRAKTAAFFSVFLLLHAAATRYILSSLISPDWAYLFEGGVANQRVLGTVFQPSTFGVLLILSIYLFLRGRAYLAILSLGLAASMHPTYLLSAGVLTATYMWITYREEKRLAKTFGIGAFALVLVLPILAYVYLSFVATPSETLARAREILVNFRIPHHAVISEWWNLTVLLDLIFITIALYLIRHTKLFTIMLTGMLVGTLLTLLQLYIQSDVLALIFPWRISVILVPLSTSIIAAYLISAAVDRFSSRWVWFNQSVLVLSIFVIALLFMAGVYRMMVDFSLKYTASDREMMSFVQQTKTMKDVYLVPTKMQDFRLVTGAPTYVDFKSIPYKDSDVLEWYRRQRLAGKFYRTNDCELLMQLADEDHLTHIVLEANTPTPPCSFLNELHRDDHYKVFIIITP